MKSGTNAEIVRGEPSGAEASSDDAAAIPAVTLTDPLIVETLPVAASLVRLEPGLFAVRINARSAGPAMPNGRQPSVWLGSIAPGGDGPAFLSARGGGEQWLQARESGVAIRVAKAGHVLLATAFGASEAPAIALQSFDGALTPVGDVAAAPDQASGPPPMAEREIRTEVIAHIERVGDKVFAGSNWAGTPGEQKRVEGFAIRPLQEIQPTEIEYKALHPGGVETPWIRGPQFCGSRGRGLPLTGFAVRIAPHVQDQFSVIYQAAFFRSGVSEPRSNGAPCLPRVSGDAVEGINIRIVQRRPA